MQNLDSLQTQVGMPTSRPGRTGKQLPLIHEAFLSAHPAIYLAHLSFRPTPFAQIINLFLHIPPREDMNL